MTSPLAPNELDADSRLPSRMLSRPWRLALGVGGALVASIGLRLAVGIASHVRVSGFTNDAATVAAFTLMLLVAGTYFIYVSATGRRRGPIYRWFMAYMDGWKP